jgi:hypothetical protein
MSAAQEAIRTLMDEDVPYLIAKRVRWHAARLARLAVDDCNYGLTEKQEREKATSRKLIAKELKPYGITCNFSGDPRGYVVKCRLPSGKYNTWGGKESGWGIA